MTCIKPSQAPLLCRLLPSQVIGQQTQQFSFRKQRLFNWKSQIVQAKAPSAASSGTSRLRATADPEIRLGGLHKPSIEPFSLFWFDDCSCSSVDDSARKKGSSSSSSSGKRSDGSKLWQGGQLPDNTSARSRVVSSWLIGRRKTCKSLQPCQLMSEHSYLSRRLL